MAQKLGLSMLMLAVGLALFLILQRPEKGLESQRPETADSEVRVHAAKRSALPLVLSEAGLLEGWREVDVVAETSGRVVSPPLRVGTDLVAGDTLARLDETTHAIELKSREAGLRQAQLALEVARRESRRIAPLHQDGVVSETDWQQVEDTVWQAEAKLAAADAARQAALEAFRHTRVAVPFAGRVVRRYLELGDFAVAGTPVARLVDLSRLRLRVGAPARLAVLAEPGLTAQLKLDAYPGGSFSGQLHSVSSSADATGLYPVEIVTEGRPGMPLLPGMLARARMEVGHREPLLQVPSSAVLRRDGRDVVFVVTGGASTVEMREVSLGARDGRTVEVVAGLQTDERVVYRGHAGLETGDRVRVIDEEP